MLFKAMTLKEAEEFYDKIKISNIDNKVKLMMLEDIIWFTDHFRRDYGSPMKKVKYYVEIVHCEDSSDFAIQSKWFDTYEQATEWYKNNIEFLGENYDAYLMYAEWDETSDSYGDIDTYEVLPRT
jgi:hypothetical protein